MRKRRLPFFSSMCRISFGPRYSVIISIRSMMKVALLIVLLTVVCIFSIRFVFSNESNSESQWNFAKLRLSNNNNNKDYSELFDERQLAPFNEILGVTSTNVPAYSNGNDTYYSNENYFLYGIYMGLKWQCVEFARRWLFLRKSCVFKSVVGANDMWQELINVERVTDGKLFALTLRPNGFRNPPKNESFLIYKRGPDMPFGHVSVIVDIVPGFVYIAEQNYQFYYWKKNYARQIPLILKNDLYYIEDKYDLYGWMEIEDNNKQLKPLDPSAINSILTRNRALKNSARS